MRRRPPRGLALRSHRCTGLLESCRQRNARGRRAAPEPAPSNGGPSVGEAPQANARKCDDSSLIMLRKLGGVTAAFQVEAPRSRLRIWPPSAFPRDVGRARATRHERAPSAVCFFTLWRTLCVWTLLCSSAVIGWLSVHHRALRRVGHHAAGLIEAAIRPGAVSVGRPPSLGAQHIIKGARAAHRPAAWR